MRSTAWAANGKFGVLGAAGRGFGTEKAQPAPLAMEPQALWMEKLAQLQKSIPLGGGQKRIDK